jgi:hypothetical protein
VWYRADPFRGFIHVLDSRNVSSRQKLENLELKWLQIEENLNQAGVGIRMIVHHSASTVNDGDQSLPQPWYHGGFGFGTF